MTTELFQLALAIIRFDSASLRWMIFEHFFWASRKGGRLWSFLGGNQRSSPLGSSTLLKHNSLPNWWLFQMSLRFFYPQKYGLLVDELLLLLIFNVNIKTNRGYSTLIHWKPWFGAVVNRTNKPKHKKKKDQRKWQSKIIKFFEPFTATVKHYATCISQFILT